MVPEPRFLSRRRPTRWVAVLILGLALGGPRAPDAAEITDLGRGPVLLPPEADGASQLGDIAFAAGTGYLLISDDASGGARAYLGRVPDTDFPLAPRF